MYHAIRFIALLVLSQLCWSPAFVLAQSTAQPQLELAAICLDDFQVDSRPEYSIQGEVLWQAGRIEISQGSSIRREMNAGSWGELELELDLGEPNKDGGQTAAALQFEIDGATDCVVAWIQTRKGGKTTGTVHLFDTVLKDGKTQFKPVRKQPFDPDQRIGNWSVSYRYGLVQVRTRNESVLAGYINNGFATLRAVRLDALAGPVGVVQLGIQGVARPPALTEEEKEELATALQLNAQVARLWREGESASAIKPAQQALEIRRRVLGKLNPACALSLLNLGAQYHSTGAYDKAEQLYVEARDIYQALGGPDHPEYAQCLNNLATLYHATRDFTDAERLHLEVRAIRKTVFGVDHLQYVQSLRNLAVTYRFMGNYSKAEPIYLESLDIRKRLQGAEHVQYADNLNDLGLVYWSLGNYARAEELYQNARDIYEKAVGTDHPHYSTSLNNLASLYLKIGDYAKAERLYLQAREIRKRVLGEDHPDYARALNNLALLYKTLGDYSKAEPLYLQSRQIRKALGTDHPDYAQSLNNLANLYRSTRDKTKAEQLYLEARDSYKEALGTDHPHYANCLSNLAGLCISQGRYAEAERLLVEARGIRKRIWSTDHPEYVESLNLLANLYYSMGDYDRAEPLFQEACDRFAAALGKNHPAYVTSLHNLSILYHTMGKTEEAESRFIEALNRQQDLAKDILAGASEAQGLNYLAQHGSALGGLLSVSRRSGAAAEDVYLSIWRGRRVLQRTTTQRNRQFHLLRTEAAGQTRQDIEDYLSTRHRIGQLIWASPKSDPGETQTRRGRLVELNNAKESLEKKLAAALPEFARDIAVDSSHPAALRDRMPADAVFIDVVRYVLSEQDPDVPGSQGRRRTPSYTAFSLHRDGMTRVELGPAKPIDQAVLQWRQLIAQRQPDREIATALSGLVWSPIVKRLPEGVSNVYLSVDGALATIPWAALRTAPDRVLLEDYAVALVPHGQFLTRHFHTEGSQQRQATGPLMRSVNEQLLLVGNVNYRDVSSRDSSGRPIQARPAPRRDAALGDKQLEWLSCQAANAK